MADPLVTIICIAYNHESYIRQCLDGFMMQKTNFPFEVLIHDDASNDNTTDIIREYEERFPDIIKPIYQKENQYSKGVQIGLTYLYPNAKGKYIAECEGDDYWTDPLKLQMQVDFLELNEDYSMCFHGARIISNINTEKGLACEHLEDRDYSATELFHVWTVPTASIVYRVECLAFPLVHQEWFLNGDIKLILTASQFGRIRGMSRVMSVYRMHLGGVSYDPSVQEERCKKYPNHYKAIKANFHNIERDIINEQLARSYVNRARIQRRITSKIYDYCCAIFYMPKKELYKSIVNFILSV